MTAAASCTEAGSRTRSCACGASETEAVEPLGHEWGAWTDETAASCTEPGSHTHACTREGCGFSETVAIDALGHDWGEPSDEVAATCTEAGSYHHACRRENCGFEETVTVDPLGHDWGEWTVLKEATKTETGEREHTCTREGCGVTVSEKIPVLPPDEFTVRFMNGETEVASVSVAENTAIGDKLPAGPDKGAAYVFEGWFDENNNAVNAETVITGPVTVAARYTYLPEGSGTASAGAVTVNATWAPGVFPEGTTLSVTDAGKDKALAMAGAAGIDAVDGEAVDITFINNGTAIQPAAGKSVSISLSLSRSLEGDSFTVLHEKAAAPQRRMLMKSAASGSASNVETVAVGASANSASFAGSSFSVYAIVGGTYQEDPTQLPRWTYEFYVGTTKVNTQIVKDGDTLYEPSVPDAGTNQRFVGWQVENETGYLDFSTPVSVTGTTDATKHVDAVFETVYHIEYRDLDGNVIRTDEAAESSSYTFDPDDPLFDTQDLNKINAGWKDQNNVTHTTDTITVSEDLTLTPDLTPGFFARFFTQGGSFVESQPLGHDELVTQPADPTKMGYAFAGWYTSADGGEAFDFSTPPNAGVDIYAHWTPAETTYTLVFMEQNADDDTYSFHSSYQKTGITESPVVLDDDDYEYGKIRNSGVQSFYVDHINPVGAVISGDGSTVVTVYCNRVWYYLEIDGTNYAIRQGQHIPSWLQANNLDSYYDLVDWDKHDLVAAHWIFSIEYNEVIISWFYLNDIPFHNAYVLNTAARNRGGIPQDQELPIGAVLKLIDFRDVEGPYGYFTDVYYESLDSTPSNKIYESPTRIEFYSTNPRVAYTDKSDERFYLVNVENYDSIIQGGYLYITVPESDDRELMSVYYDRKRFDISFYTMGGEMVIEDIENVFYDADIESYEPTEYVVGETTKQEQGVTYVFSGWYLDSLCNNPFTWTDAKMPAKHISLYAGWTPLTSTVTFDPNGGTLNGPETVTVNTGAQVSQPTDPTPGEAGAIFLGWTHNGKTYDFSSPVAGDITLVAQWSTSTVYTVKYDPAPYGTFSPETDPKSYLEDAAAVVLGAPTVTDSTKLFTGWTIKPVSRSGRAGSLLLPGDSFAIDKTQADANKEITLVAQYADKPGLTTLTYEPNGGQGSAHTDTNIGENNETTPVKAPGAVGISPQPGWEFEYWSTNADGSGDKFHDGEPIALNLNGVRVLYAQWKQSTINIPVTKKWDDQNDRLGRRPGAVTIQLLANGVDTGETLTLTAAGQWSGVFTDLPTHIDGVAIRYTVTEDRVLGYQAPVITGSATAGFTVTNRLRHNPWSPQTGDHTPWLPWLSALLLSGLALAGDAVLRSRKRRYSGKHER